MPGAAPRGTAEQDHVGSCPESSAGLSFHELHAPLEVGAGFLEQKRPPHPVNAVGRHRLPPGLPAAGTGADGAGKVLGTGREQGRRSGTSSQGSHRGARPQKQRLQPKKGPSGWFLSVACLLFIYLYFAQKLQDKSWHPLLAPLGQTLSGCRSLQEGWGWEGGGSCPTAPRGWEQPKTQSSSAGIPGPSFCCLSLQMLKAKPRSTLWRRSSKSHSGVVESLGASSSRHRPALSRSAALLNVTAVKSQWL